VVSTVRVTNDDKRMAVSRMLSDEEWAKWSDREIARKCRVSLPHKFRDMASNVEGQGKLNL